MRIAKNNVMSFTPDHSGYRARFQAPAGNAWDEPVVGFAVVVKWTGWDEEKGGVTQFDDEADLVETMLVPVVFDDRWLMTALEYAENRGETKFLGLMAP